MEKLNCVDLDPERRRRRVVIIGGGVAGLHCAGELERRLRGNGVDDVELVILEAQGRIGGRVRSEVIGGHTVDTGAAWVHGVCLENPIVKLLGSSSALNGTGDDAPFLQASCRNIWIHGPDEGDNCSFYQTKDDERKWEKRMQRLSSKIVCEGNDMPGPSLSLEDALRLDEEPLSSYEKRRLDWLCLWFGKRAVDIPILEWHGDLQFGDYPGSHSLVKGGMESVVVALKSKLHHTRILINAEASKFIESAHEILVETTDGRAFKCDYVVITASLGMLKAKLNSDWIEPPLPKDVLGAISRLDMSSYTKVICTVSETAASSMPVWIFLDDSIFPQAFNYFPVKKVPVVVLLSIDPFAHDVLKAHSGGARGYAQQLLPCCVNEGDILECRVTDWSSDAWAAGAYSAFSTRSKDGDIAAFYESEELLQRRIRFAGEATHEIHQGSVHGALLSGERAAADIASSLMTAATLF